MKTIDLGRLVEARLASSLLSPRERCLMPLLYKEDPTAADIKTLTDGLDLDTENQNYLLMLARLGFTKKWDKFPQEIIPRLKGVHHYHQVHNTIGFSGLVRQIRALTDAGIPVMLIKGIAVRVYYAPNAPRIMWDYDIAVPKVRFEEAVRLLCEKNGPAAESLHSVTIKSEDIELDLHRWIFKTNGERESDIWERAIQTSFCGTEVYVPSAEDMLIHLLDTQSRTILQGEGSDRRMQWLCDCRSVMRSMEKLDLTRLAARAREFHSVDRVHMTLKLFAQCFPALVTEDEVDQAFPPTAEYYRMMANGERYRVEKQEYLSRYQSGVLNSMTPAHIVRSLRLALTRYRYLGHEIGEQGKNLSFVRYMIDVHYADSLAALKEKYQLQISLNGRSLKVR